MITVPMGVKLPPYFDPAHHTAMGEVIGRCGVDFLNLINSVGNGLIVDPEREEVVIKPKGGFGGLGGTIIKPVALANVRAFWKIFEGRMPIIGTGGIVNGVDAFEHILCGASAVQSRDGVGRGGGRRVRPIGNGAGGTAQQEGLYEVGGLPGKAEGVVGLLGPEGLGKETQLQGPSE